MQVQTNGDYNPVQLNETLNFDPNGKVLSKSLMINIRNEEPKIVWKLFQELKGLIESKEITSKKTEKPETQDKVDRICPECGWPLIEKLGISKKTGRSYHFWGCSNFPRCKYTEAFIEGENSIAREKSIVFEY